MRYHRIATEIWEGILFISNAGELNPSIHKFDDVFIYSGLSAALGHEPFDFELMAERLGPNGVRDCRDYGEKIR